MDLDNSNIQQVVEKLNKHFVRSKLFFYEPYPKQVQFHHTLARERCLMAPNQTGKTIAGGAEFAYHLTGLYPNWWKGNRYEEPIKSWASGVTGISTRDNAQRILLGDVGQEGTGYIPDKSIINIQKAIHGPQGMVDFITVEYNNRHSSAQGVSYCFFKSYEQGREKWQGPSLHLVWYDEEPPMKIYQEGLARTNAREGIVFLTFTPLLGMSDVVRRFLFKSTESRVLCHMDIQDAKHYSKEKIKEILEGYEEYERDARGHGRPVLGEGAVFPVLEDGIKVHPFEIPNHWPKICGIDFGWTHPTAMAWLAHDKDTDVVYLYDAYAESKRIISHHASAIKGRGQWIPMAWPPDGQDTEPRGGEAVINLYRREGINALPEFAKYPDTRGNSLEASVADMLNRMQTGRFKVFSHLDKWWREFRLYHRKDGKIVRIDDDVISAARYAIMRLCDAMICPDYMGHQTTGRYRRKTGGRSFMSN